MEPTTWQDFDLDISTTINHPTKKKHKLYELTAQPYRVPRIPRTASKSSRKNLGALRFKPPASDPVDTKLISLRPNRSFASLPSLSLSGARRRRNSKLCPIRLRLGRRGGQWGSLILWAAFDVVRELTYGPVCGHKTVPLGSLCLRGGVSLVFDLPRHLRVAQSIVHLR